MVVDLDLKNIRKYDSGVELKKEQLVDIVFQNYSGSMADSTIFRSLAERLNLGFTSLYGYSEVIFKALMHSCFHSNEVSKDFKSDFFVFDEKEGTYIVETLYRIIFIKLITSNEGIRKKFLQTGVQTNASVRGFAFEDLVAMSFCSYLKDEKNLRNWVESHVKSDVKETELAGKDCLTYFGRIATEDTPNGPSNMLKTFTADCMKSASFPNVVPFFRTRAKSGAPDLIFAVRVDGKIYFCLVSVKVHVKCPSFSTMAESLCASHWDSPYLDFIFPSGLIYCIVVPNHRKSDSWMQRGKTTLSRASPATLESERTRKIKTEIENIAKNQITVLVFKDDPLLRYLSSEIIAANVS